MSLTLRTPDVSEVSPKVNTNTRRTWRNYLRTKGKTFKQVTGLNTLPSFTQWAISRGYLKGEKLHEVAELSTKASNLRRDATVVATLNALAASGTASTAAAIAAGATVVGLPVAVGLLALSVGISNLMSMVSMNEEFHANLAVIQHEVDRFQRIAKVMEVIATKHKFQLNTTGVDAFLGKLNRYIAYMSTPDVAEMIKLYRQDSVVENPAIQQSSFWDKIAAKRDRMFAPGECLRQLVRDITILTVFMTILIGEFILFYEYQTSRPGGTKNISWSQDPQFKMMLYDTIRLREGIQTLNKTPEEYQTKQLASIKTSLEAYPLFYNALSGTTEIPETVATNASRRVIYEDLQRAEKVIAQAKREVVEAQKNIEPQIAEANAAIGAAEEEEANQHARNAVVEAAATGATPDPSPPQSPKGGKRKRDKTKRRRRYR